MLLLGLGLVLVLVLVLDCSVGISNGIVVGHSVLLSRHLYTHYFFTFSLHPHIFFMLLCSLSLSLSLSAYNKCFSFSIENSEHSI